MTTRLSTSVTRLSMVGITLAILGTSATAQAADDGLAGDIKATVAFQSDYIFRGIGYNDNDPVVHGVLQWRHDMGVYAGVSGYNGKFNQGSVELRYFLGYANSIGNFNYDVFTTYYTYPGDAADADYIEFTGKLGYDFGIASLSGGVAYAPDGQDAFMGGHDLYLFSDLAVPIPHTPITAKFHVGRRTFDTPNFMNYTDYSAGVHARVFGLDMELAYIDTNLPNALYGNIANDHVIFSVGKSF